MVYLGLKVEIRPYCSIYMEWLRKTMDEMGCRGRFNFQVAYHQGISCSASNCHCAVWSAGGVDAGHARHREHYRMEAGVTLHCGADNFSFLLSTQNTTEP